MKRSGIAELYKSKSTVFTPPDLAALWGISSVDYIKTRIKYYVKNGYLFRLSHGLYSKDKNEFDVLEAANKLRAPSYVSLETVLAREGVVFQKYSNIFLVSYSPRTVRIGQVECVYRKIKDDILFNSNGIVNTGTYSIATKERAFLDAIYLYKDYFFDNIAAIDWGKVDELLEVYSNASLNKRVEDYKAHARSN